MSENSPRKRREYEFVQRYTSNDPRSEEATAARGGAPPTPMELAVWFKRVPGPRFDSYDVETLAGLIERDEVPPDFDVNLFYQQMAQPRPADRQIGHSPQVPPEAEPAQPEYPAAPQPPTDPYDPTGQ